MYSRCKTQEHPFNHFITPLTMPLCILKERRQIQQRFGLPTAARLLNSPSCPCYWKWQNSLAY
jgi:hypothetical protein